MLRFKPNPLFWFMLFVALLSLGGAVFAQEATGSSGLLSALLPSLTGVLGGTDAIVGIVITFALTIMPSSWPWKVKTNVTWLVCFAMAVVVTLAQGKLTGDFSDMTVISAKFAFILTVAKNFYDGALRSTIGPSLSRLTDIKPLITAPSGTSSLGASAPTPGPSGGPTFDETPIASVSENAPDFNIPEAVSTSPVELKDEVIDQIVHRVTDALRATI